MAPMGAATVDELASPLAHSLSHAWFGSSHVWLDEGVAQFMSLLWIEQTQGREVAVATSPARDKRVVLGRACALYQTLLLLTADRVSSAPATRSNYRTKAAAVLWMLRSIVGDRRVAAGVAGLPERQAGQRPEGVSAGP